MAQFLEIKAANPDCILWYRMGDFYELFFEDAVVASNALGIVLTKRGKHLGEDIPMCGVPIHRADEYLQRLIRHGFRVAVCEQLEDPAEARKRGSKSVVRRDVVRLVTPGTLTEDTLLDARSRNYLTAVHLAPSAERGRRKSDASSIALASVDISTGEFEIGSVAAGDFDGELARLNPAEVLLADTQTGPDEVSSSIKAQTIAISPVPAQTFDSLAGERLLKAQLGVSDLSAFGAFSRSELAAVGALLKYIELTQIGRRPLLRPPRLSGSEAVMVIDAATRASLELVRSSAGEKSGSLLGAIDRTVTGAGARELGYRLASPARDRGLIERRLDAVEYLADRDVLRQDLRDALKRAPDLARAMSRLQFQRGGPRDLASVRDALAAASTAARLLGASGEGLGLPADLRVICERLATDDGGLLARLNAALVEEPPPFRRDGGFVRAGFSPEIDEARALREDSRKVMLALEARYIDETSIRSLKVRHNNILGYFVEVTANAAKPLFALPLSETFQHRQTMVSAVRFTTRELVEIEGRIASAGERALNLEQDVFNALAESIAGLEQSLAALAAALAELDCLQSLAEIAIEQGYVRPSVSDGIYLEISGGRHPVVEQSLKAQKAGPFIENDCVLGRPPVGDQPQGAELYGPGFDEMADGRLWLVTGPNMAGKSTFLRQNALIVVLAQTGSFVPAKSARIGLADRLFSRVGASDDIARGRSTFMVEMVETAGILNQASAYSIVILDEIGRGTATFDGLSIAWATVEHLHETVRCRTLFATHFHELTALASRLKEISNVTIEVREWQDNIVFLHKVRPGVADRSYGVQVAKLAGMPAAVIKRAAHVLRTLESSELNGVARVAGALIDDLPLFAAARPAGFAPSEPMTSPTPPPESAVEKELAELKLDELTPKQAQDALYRLKGLLEDPPQ